GSLKLLISPRTRSDAGRPALSALSIRLVSWETVSGFSGLEAVFCGAGLGAGPFRCCWKSQKFCPAIAVSLAEGSTESSPCDISRWSEIDETVSMLDQHVQATWVHAGGVVGGAGRDDPAHGAVVPGPGQGARGR